MTQNLDKFNPNSELLSKIQEFSKFNTQSKNTIKSYKYNLWDFCKFISIKLKIPIKEKQEINQQTIQILNQLCEKSDLEITAYIAEYLSELIKKGQSTSTISAKLSAIKDYFAQIPRDGDFTKRLNLTQIRAPKIEKKKIKGPTIEEFNKLISEIEKIWEKAEYIEKRNCLLFYIENFCGLRISEVLSIDIEQISLKECLIRLHRKGLREKVELSIPPITASKIEEFLKIDGRKKGPLFVNCDTHAKGRLSRQSAWQIYVNFTEKVCGRRIGPHRFRHFYADEALEISGNNKDIAMKFTGHKSPKVFDQYTEDRENHHLKIATDLEKKWIKNE